jgi:hypothetical protein
MTFEEDIIASDGFEPDEEDDFDPDKYDDELYAPDPAAESDGGEEPAGR